MAGRAFLGTWEVVKFQYEKETTEVKGLQGIKFHLDESGNVTWIVPDELSDVPLFKCDTYEVCGTRSCLGFNVCLRFGAYAGHIIEFLCYHNRKDSKSNQIMLYCDGWCEMHCKQVANYFLQGNDVHFSLLPALEEGYFSDINLTSVNNKSFATHSVILELIGDEIDWSSNRHFQNLPESVLGTILHYLYAECLPNTMDDATAEQVIQAIATYECLNKLSDLCQTFLRNNALKRQLIGLVNDMHIAINHVIDNFVNFNMTAAAGSDGNGEWHETTPGHLCFIIKQALRDTAVVCAKLLLLCDLFNKKKGELAREERQEIVAFANSRVPILVMQVLKFFQAIKRTFSGMTYLQRQEVAIFLVPEVDYIFDLLTDLVNDTNVAIESVLEVLTPYEVQTQNNVADKLSTSLCKLLHSKDIIKCRTLHEIVSGTLEALNSKKENFMGMTLAQRIRTVTRNFEQLIEELTFFLNQLEWLPSALDDKLEMSEFKFCFKVGTSKIAGVLETLVKHRELLQTCLQRFTRLVQREAFVVALQQLDLMEKPATSRAANEETHEERKSTPKHHQQPNAFKLNLVNSLCMPPGPKQSYLAKKALQLFKSERGTDMVFKIILPSSSDDESQTHENEEAIFIKAHRVIVAARCDWFRRALQSGMRESIDRKIDIHDTSPFLFRIFLEYLYSGKIDDALSLSTEQYTDLLLLSDRYEVDALKQHCECALQSSIDMESALYYLSMADQFNALMLKTACISFITTNRELTENEIFYELPIALQAEIFDAVWVEPPKARKPCLFDIDTFPDFPGRNRDTTPDEIEDMPTPDNTRLQACIAEMRDILGDGVAHDSLVQFALAADYDLCRAINYYYARNPSDE